MNAEGTGLRQIQDPLGSLEDKLFQVVLTCFLLPMKTTPLVLATGHLIFSG